MPRTKPAEQRRADLLASARALFVTKGVAATRLEDITSGAGVSAGLFYQYYRSKDDVVFALQEQYSEQFAQCVRAATDAVASWPAKLDACVEACFDRFLAEHELHDVLFRHTAPRADDPDRPPAHNALVAAVRSLLAAGVAAGAFAVDDVDGTALLLYAVMHAFDPTFRAGSDLPDARLIHATQRLFRQAAGVAEPPPPMPAAGAGGEHTSRHPADGPGAAAPPETVS